MFSLKPPLTPLSATRAGLSWAPGTSSQQCPDHMAWPVHAGQPTSPGLLVPEDRDTPPKPLHSLCPVQDPRPSAQKMLQGRRDMERMLVGGRRDLGIEWEGLAFSVF